MPDEVIEVLLEYRCASKPHATNWLRAVASQIKTQIVIKATGQMTQHVSQWMCGYSQCLDIHPYEPHSV